ncbi:hypothetical protein G7048_25325 (plasmid) [Diaphorobacter sp. HDW4B]|uniref:hypothetical protein n=1 Tax=Diaphorobacter sp. HDW4B TaxID=2714925 RepID=UPI00140BC8F1|nr:hypothetical protein [Diaphorobacter sp. HDW4B]QIL73828.1 hypothetical protein G7048_25325 [Diaphorobacter sp. HDW4B]
MTIQRRPKPIAGFTAVSESFPLTALPALRTPSTHLMIGTPAYGGMVHLDYLNSLLAYQQAGISYTLAGIGNESLITRARNTLLSMFWANDAYSHLLFLDADVSLPPEALKHMLAQERDVIGAPVALKGRNAQGARIFNIGRCLGEAGEQILVEHIGTAALLLSRKAVGALVKQAIQQGRVYKNSRETLRGDYAADTPMYDVFQVGVVDDGYMSEDFWVCRQLRALGFNIHVQIDVVTQHQGVMPA